MRKLSRIRWGITFLLCSGLVSWLVSEAIGVDSVGSVAVSSVVAFCGGAIFASGVPRVS